MKLGGIEVVMKVIEKHIENSFVCEAACAALDGFSHYSTLFTFSHITFNSSLPPQKITEDCLIKEGNLGVFGLMSRVISKNKDDVSVCKEGSFVISDAIGDIRNQTNQTTRPFHILIFPLKSRKPNQGRRIRMHTGFTECD